MTETSTSTSTAMLEDDKPRRGRPPRSEIESGRRKKRGDGGVIGKRLGVSASAMDFGKYAYRWINDTPARLMTLTKEDDWDVVHQNGGVVKEDSPDLGSAVSQIVGSNPDGSPLRAYLCRKLKTYYDEDQKAKADALDHQLAELRRGNARDGTPLSDYVPHSGIKVS